MRNKQEKQPRLRSHESRKVQQPKLRGFMGDPLPSLLQYLGGFLGYYALSKCEWG